MYVDTCLIPALKKIAREVLQDAQQHAPDDRPGNAAEAPQDRPGKGLDPDEPEVGIEIDDRRDQHARDAADAGADGPGQREDRT